MSIRFVGVCQSGEEPECSTATTALEWFSTPGNQQAFGNLILWGTIIGAIVIFGMPEKTFRSLSGPKSRRRR